MELWLRMAGVLLRILYLVTAPLYWLRARRHPHQRLSPPGPLLLKSVKEYLEDIRNGQLTSKELTSAYVERAKEVNPLINAVSDERYELALEEADSADQEIRKARENGLFDNLLKKKPLIGIPFTVKESCQLSGMSNSTGHLDYKGQRAVSDGETVKLVREAGAIPLLVSNTPELCLSWETTNLLRGTTKNPYCLSRTAGGSSGGEAALLASGASTFGVGSDIAGSIRLPASYCGVFGHKPTPGIVPIKDHIPTLDDENFPKYLSLGPMTRKAEDLPLVLGVMAGKNREKLNLEAPVDIKNLKVQYMTEMPASPALQGVSGPIRDAVRNAAVYLQQCGATLTQNKYKDLDESVEISTAQFFTLRNMPKLLQEPANPKRDRSLLMEIIRSLMGASSRTLHVLAILFMFKTKLFLSEANIPHYKRLGDGLLQQFKNTLGDSGVFLCPVYNGPAHYHDQAYFTLSGTVYTMIFNILGMPATSVPMGLHNGLPISIQVVAAPHQDRLCLAVARHLEAGFGGWRPPPQIL